MQKSKDVELIRELISLQEDMSNFGQRSQRDPVFVARMKIKDLAKDLKIASGELMLRYGRQLNRVENNPQRALNYLELAMKLPRGRLKGFDKLYSQVTKH